MTNKQITLAFVCAFVGEVALMAWIAILSTVVIGLRRERLALQSDVRDQRVLIETLNTRTENLSSRIPPRDPPPDRAWKPVGMFDGIGPPKRLEFTIE